MNLTLWRMAWRMRTSRRAAATVRRGNRHVVRFLLAGTANRRRG